jgi:hypothetical protein
MAAWAAADAAAGHYLLAIAGLAGAALAVALLLLWWGRTLTGAMVTTDASTARAVRPASRRAWLHRLHPRGRAGAVAVRELRYNWREPRRRSAWVPQLFGGIGPFLLLRQDSAGADGVYVVCLTAGIVGLQAANQLGIDGPATWMHVATWRILGTSAPTSPAVTWRLPDRGADPAGDRSGARRHRGIRRFGAGTVRAGLRGARHRVRGRNVASVLAPSRCRRARRTCSAAVTAGKAAWPE